jgi:NADH:ubiquinone oxidoreductase subunit 5 (subunit L)/multisubunit Na+/H+ antiporter MnhA subunit
MPVLGGLKRKMPYTAYTMLAATLAISGVPFFSGFYSKDAILASALYRVWQSPQHFLLFLLPFVGAAMTAFYMFRMWFLVFDGEPCGYIPPLLPEAAAHVPDDTHAHGHGHDDAHGHGHDDAHAAAPAHGHDLHHGGNPYDHAHESEPIMVWPLILLAIPTIFIGWTAWIGVPASLLHLIGLPSSEPLLEHMLAYGEPIEANDLGAAHLLAFAASLLVAATGIGLGILYYYPPVKFLIHPRVPIFQHRRRANEDVKRFGPIYGFLVKKWMFDELYNAVFVRPTLALARASSQFDKWIIDGIVNGLAQITELLSRAEGLFDNIAVDGLVNLTARIVYAVGDWGRGLQTGRLRNYLMVLAVALVGLFAGVFAWVQRG